MLLVHIFFRYSRFDHRYVKISLLSPFMARTAPQIARGLFFLSLTSQKRTQFVCFSWPITEVYFYCYNNTNICKINTHSQGRTKPLWSSKFKDHTVCTPYVPTFFLLPATSPQFASLTARRSSSRHKSVEHHFWPTGALKYYLREVESSIMIETEKRSPAEIYRFCGIWRWNVTWIF